MAKGKRTNFTHFCPETGQIIGNGTYNKSTHKVSDLGKRMHSPACRKHVQSIAKDTKKGN